MALCGVWNGEDRMIEYSVEWFKWQRDNHKEWLGTQALRLLEHYEELEAIDSTYAGYIRQLKHIEKLEALLDSAYPFIAGHNWVDCDCPRCMWIRSYNELVGSESIIHSPQLDNVPATKEEGSHGWTLKGG